jgi:hypothetical protein
MMMSAREARVEALHLFVLCSFAVAQPLYELLGRAPEFFVAHRAGPIAILSLALALTAGVPGLLVLVEALAARAGSRIRRHVHTTFVGALATLAMLPVADRLASLPADGVITVALLAGLGTAAAHRRLMGARSFLTALSPGMMIFPLAFLLFTPVRGLVVPARAAGPTRLAIATSVPVVLIVFDQLSAPALLDDTGAIDAVRYPHFAALARESWWFPRATAAHPYTAQALAAILTGRLPEADRLPVMAHYPENLFTWLGSSFRLNVSEPMTALCPASLCVAEGEPDPFAFRPWRFLSDLMVVYLHVVLPEEYATRMLPPLDASWRDFRSDVMVLPASNEAPASWHGDPGFLQGVQLGRHRHVERFVESLGLNDARTLHFLHVLLPHHPYQYLASGQIYSPGWAPEGLVGDGTWEQSQQLVLTAYHQYIQQVGFVDRLLGMVVAHLKRNGLYDRALVIITADHGVAFVPGEPSRAPTDATYVEVLSVPMFVKRPGQGEGRVSDRLVSTVDVVPTIADVLGATLPWHADGASMVADSFTERAVVEVHGFGGSGPLEFNPDPLGRPPASQAKVRALGVRTPLEDTAVAGPHAELIGQDLTALPVAGTAQDIRLTAATLPQFEEVDLDSGFVPALLRGHVRTNESRVAPLDLAIALNGRVRTTTTTVDRSPGLAYFAALLPGAAFRQGPNDLEVFIVDESTGSLRLLRVLAPIARRVRIERDQTGQERLVVKGGQAIAIRPELVQGWVDRVQTNPPWLVRLIGWAADLQGQQPASSVLIFADDELVFSGTPTSNRDDVAAAYGQPGVRRSGFAIELARDSLDETPGRIRVFGVSEGGVAGELKLTEQARELLHSLGH